ncbi:MAG: phosphodiester glycosidase family protein, partial [Deltaproteobacteria bacterium]|nr:phosphodiester glycosidase family protein [Deltaproteobacteria bacterium]
PRSAKVEEMVAWARAGGETVEAAVNGDYYPPGLASRDPLGLLIARGRILSAARGTTGLLLDSQNRAHVGRYPVEMRVVGDGVDLGVADMNRKAGRNEAVLYAGRFRTKSEAQWGCTALRLLPPIGEPMVNRTVPATVVAVGDAGRMRKLEADEYLLVACGKAAEALAGVSESTQLSLETRVPDVDWVPVEALSGGPRILREGRVSIETREERLTPGMKGWVPKRHPRTAAGTGGDGRTLFLLVAEGRLPHTEGMTAAEAACVLRHAGASDALLFDGGGSSSLLLGEKFVNKPQMWRNRSGRSVADTLAVVRAGGPTGQKKE